MYKLITYLKFLLNSTNQHGVHSPFVYDYITKCLYTKPKKTSSIAGHVLLNSIDYFHVKNVWFSSDQEKLLKEVSAQYAAINLDNSPYDLIFVDASDLDQNLNDLTKNVHNDTLAIVNAIYKNKANTIRWRKIKELGRVTVTIDMYHCGAVFFRKEQATEHFTIRI